MLKLLAAVSVLLATLPAVAQPTAPPADWKDWTPMLGEWEADTTGPGNPTLSFPLAI